MKDQIAVVAEHRLGRINPVTYEAIACALEIAKIAPSRVTVITIGEDAEEAGRTIASVTGLPVLAVNVRGLSEYNGDAFRSILHAILAELEAAWVCVPGDSQGMDFGPGLAVRLGGACITGVERVVGNGGEPAFERTLFNGKIVAEMVCSRIPATILVQPGAFKASFPGHENPGEFRSKTIEWAPARIKSLGLKNARAADSALCEASVVVSAGRGVGRKENLELAHRVAAMFSRSAVAGSRPICDLGWLPYQAQVGQTGATVAPELYLACGISGAQQHLSGMAASKFIVAVNTDPNAAIFNVADIGIVEDIEGFLLELLDEYKASQE